MKGNSDILLLTLFPSPIRRLSSSIPDLLDTRDTKTRPTPTTGNTLHTTPVTRTIIRSANTIVLGRVTYSEDGVLVILGSGEDG